MNKEGILDQCYLHESRFYLLSGVIFLEATPPKVFLHLWSVPKILNFFLMIIIINIWNIKLYTLYFSVNLNML